MSNYRYIELFMIPLEFDISGIDGIPFFFSDVLSYCYVSEGALT